MSKLQLDRNLDDVEMIKKQLNLAILREREWVRKYDKLEYKFWELEIDHKSDTESLSRGLVLCIIIGITLGFSLGVML